MAPQYHSRVWGRLIFLLFVLLLALVVGAGGGLYYLLHRSQGSSHQRVSFFVGPGDGVSAIADRLKRDGLIDNTFLFKLDARLQSLSSHLEVGDYIFRRNMSIDDMVGTLQHYQPVGIRFTDPEGWRAEQIAAQLNEKGLDGRTFLALVRHPDAALLRSMPRKVLGDKPAAAGLEGYLFPDTYELAPGEPPRQIIVRMVTTLNDKLARYPQMMSDLLKQGRSLYTVLTLASIVEREARVPSERRVIAGVYVNRLSRQEVDKKLQADPTVQYILGSSVPITTGPTSKKWWPVLQDQAANVAPNNPYNTYTHAGMPPGPIADPGLSSIQAALYPARTDYLYFVACKGNHGRHIFARTYAQHQTDVARCTG